MKITKVELWNDTGFVDGAAEVPSMTDVLPAADVTITDELRPAKDELFSRLKISSVREQTEETTVFWSFEDLVNVSYVAIKYDRLDYTIYGWVDNVLMISDSPTPVTAIDWHIDYWRTFISSAKFGYGLVQKRPRGDVDPPQNLSYRYRTAEVVSHIFTSKVLWGFLVIADESTDKKTVDCKILFAPIFPAAGELASGCLFKTLDSSVPYKAPTLDDWMSGSIAEKMGISASAVKAAFISWFAPYAYTGTGTPAGTGVEADPVIIGKLSTYSITVFGTVTDGPRMMFTRSKHFEEQSSIVDNLVTSDDVEYIVVNNDGSPVGSLPWGMTVRTLKGRIVVSSSSCYVQFRADGGVSNAEGLEFTIPQPSVDIVSNSWSDYLISGQRDYDMQQRKLAAQQALVGAVTGGMSSAFQTGVFGGIGSGGVSEQQTQQLQKMMMKQYRGDKGASQIASIVGGGANTALRSGAGMLGVGLAGAAVDYATTQYFNGRLQSAEDSLKVKQIDSIQLPGDGWDWLWFGAGISIIGLRPDIYSVNRFNQDVFLNGVKVSEPISDCTSLVKTGGPLQIQQAIVTGEIPVQARNYIANRLSEGVRIGPVTIKGTMKLSEAKSVSHGYYQIENDLDQVIPVSVTHTDGTIWRHSFASGEVMTVALIGKRWSYTVTEGDSGTMNVYEIV